MFKRQATRKNTKHRVDTSGAGAREILSPTVKTVAAGWTAAVVSDSRSASSKDFRGAVLDSLLGAGCLL